MAGNRPVSVRRMPVRIREGVLKVADDGQITIPRCVLERCGLTAGMEVEITTTGQGLHIRNKAIADKFAAFLELAHQRAEAGESVLGTLAEAGLTVDDYMREVRGHDFCD